MTDAAITPQAFTPAGATPKMPRQKLQPLRALRAIRRLVADKDDTQQVFEIMQSMNGDSTAQGYRRLLTSAEGGRQAYMRVELNDLLNDRAWVDAFAPGTVGAAYRHFTRSEGLTSEGLAEESRIAAERRGIKLELEHPMAWFGRRIRDTHDIWHTLTGYGRDGLGELCLVAFSFGQTRSLGWAVIAVGGMLSALRLPGGMRVVRAVFRAWKDGRNAAWLPGQDYERLLNEPVDAARKRLNIATPELYLAVPEAWRTNPLAAPAMA